MNSFTSGDLLAKHISTKQKKELQLLVCDICFNSDEFSLCADCFNKFNQKILRYKANTKKDNYDLSKAIKEYIDKRKNEIEKFNKISARKSNIENLSKLISIAKTRINKNKENLENLNSQKESFQNKIRAFEENIITTNNSMNLLKKNYVKISELLQKKNSEKNICIKNFLKKILKLIFCGNKIFLFAEIFEKDEYVLPTLDKAAGSRKKFFDDFSNILSTEVKSFENFCLEDHKKPHLFEKYLKTKDSVINYNMNPYPYSNEKCLKQHERDFYNKLFVFEINNYVHKIILFVKITSKFFNIKLPCCIENDSYMEIIDNFDFSCEVKKLQIPENYIDFNESATFAALLALDKNLIFIKDYLGIKNKKSGLLPSYFNSSNYNEKNNFEMLPSNNYNYNDNPHFYDKSNDYASNTNNELNHHLNLHKNYTNIVNNYYQNDSKRRNNSVSINLNTKGNLENTPGFSFNVINKPNIATCNNMEFNTDFLNITPFFIFCGESFEVEKFNKNCIMIQKEYTKSSKKLHNLITANNNNNNNNLVPKEHKNNQKSLNEKTYEILNEKEIDCKDVVYNNTPNYNNNLNKNKTNENQDDFVFEDIGVTEGIINNDKNAVLAKSKNEEDHISEFVIIDDYFAKNRKNSNKK